MNYKLWVCVYVLEFVNNGIRFVEMQPKCLNVINNVVTVLEKLPDFEMKFARQL